MTTRPPTEPRCISSPIYFGPRDRSLFGCLHQPSQHNSGARVLICGPLGYEGQFAYLALRELATRLVETVGATVMRFDYDGCGDSAGSDEDSGRVPRWIESIHCAIEKLKELAPDDGPITLVGMRAGALLASIAAASRDDITAVAMWAPCQSGKLFLREQRAFAAMAYVTAARTAETEPAWGERGFEANGYVFSDDTVRALEALDLKKLARAPAPRVLVLERDDLPSKNTIPESWRQSAKQIDQTSINGYAESMEPPWLSTRPAEAVSKLCEWVQKLGDTSKSFVVKPFLRADAVTFISDDATERAGWYDDEQERFSILTEPREGRTSCAVILITSTFGYRIGPNRMNVFAARSLTASNISTLRIDLAGVGETRVPSQSGPNPPYHLEAVHDVRLAIRFLQSRGYRNIALGGICAGAFLAWQTALAEDAVSQIVLINPETFFPISYDVEDHRRIERAPQTWREAVRKEQRLAGKAALVWKRIIRGFMIGQQSFRALLPISVARPPLILRLQSLAKRHTRTSIVFSSADPGVREFRRQLGSSIHYFRRTGSLTTTYIDGPDHSFTPRWANRILVAQIVTRLREWITHVETMMSPGSERPVVMHATERGASH